MLKTKEKFNIGVVLMIIATFFAIQHIKNGSTRKIDSNNDGKNDVFINYLNKIKVKERIIDIEDSSSSVTIFWDNKANIIKTITKKKGSNKKFVDFFNEGELVPYGDQKILKQAFATKKQTTAKTYIYSLDRKLRLAVFDTNNDSTPDSIMFYDKYGRPKGVFVDIEKDGQLDLFSVFENGIFIAKKKVSFLANIDLEFLEKIIP